METTHTLDTVNAQLIKAIDIIIAYNKSEGLPVTSDSAMGKIITPSFPSIVKELRKGARNVPHIGLLRFVAAFPYDMNYFYDDRLDFIYPPQKLAPTKAAKIVEEQLDNSLKDFFFATPEVSTEAQEALVDAKENLVELFGATTTAAKSALLTTILDTMTAFVTQTSVSRDRHMHPSHGNDLALEVFNLKTELILHQKDYKTLSQKYVALLEKQLA